MLGFNLILRHETGKSTCVDKQGCLALPGEYKKPSLGLYNTCKNHKINCGLGEHCCVHIKLLSVKTCIQQAKVRLMITLYVNMDLAVCNIITGVR